MVNNSNNKKNCCKPTPKHCNHENNLPSEFYQVERTITDINNHPPTPGENGYWMIWNPSTHKYETSDIKIPVYSGDIDVSEINGGDSSDFTTGRVGDVLTTHIQMRSDTEEKWISNDPLLFVGEIGLTTDGENKGRFKIGDGITAWSGLSYYGSGATGDYVTIDMIENGEVSIPIATATQSGGILSSNEQNSVYVDPSSGVASISSLSVAKLSQEDGTVLVLDGGDADAIASV